MRLTSIISILFTILLVSGSENSQNQSIVPCGPFLGQVPPTNAPKIFSPDFLSKENVVGFTISPDGMEIYFCKFFSNDPKILVTKRINDCWTHPAFTQFNQDHFGGPPHISPDGLHLYWRTDRAFPENWPGQRPKPGTREGIQFWVITKSNNGWDNAHPLELPIPFGTNLLGLSTMIDGTIYTSISFQLIRFRRDKNEYSKAEKLPHYLKGHSPAIAPDESFMVFVNGTPRKLFVTFREEQDSWTHPQSLGDKINLRGMNGYPSITPDGKYLFYTVKHKLFWVSTDKIK